MKDSFPLMFNSQNGFQLLEIAASSYFNQIEIRTIEECRVVFIK